MKNVPLHATFAVAILIILDAPRVVFELTDRSLSRTCRMKRRTKDETGTKGIQTSELGKRVAPRKESIRLMPRVNIERMGLGNDRIPYPRSNISAPVIPEDIPSSRYVRDIYAASRRDRGEEGGRQ